jgi:glycosyltransferase involved in cell wall biosynthesis
MKIALIAPSHLPSRRANTLQVMKMAQAFTCLGHTVRVAVPVKPAQPVPWDELAHLYGLRVQFPVEWLPARSFLRRYDYGLGAVRWAQRWDADLLYTRLPQAAAIASAIGLATILEVHDLPASAMGVWLFRRFLRGTGKRRLVAITHALAADLVEKLGAPQVRAGSSQAPANGSAAMPGLTVVAPDGVDLERYADLPRPEQARQMLDGAGIPLSLPPDRFTVGYTGHLYAGRGINMILEMARRLPEVAFLLVGGEPEEVTKLRDAVQSRSLANVTSTGFVPNAELSRYHAACDAFLMPYQRRVAASSGGDIARYLSPMKLFEYMACGRPILCSDLPVLREVLNPENAVLLPPDDVEAWVAALESLKGDPLRRSILGARTLSEVERYAWEARAQHILNGIDNAS